MDRSLSKRFADEQTRRLIGQLTQPEELRAVALQLLELKIAQERVFFAMLMNGSGLDAADVQAALNQAGTVPVDPYDDPL